MNKKLNTKKTDKPAAAKAAVQTPKANTKPVFYTKLVRKCGEPVSSKTLSETEYNDACKQNRVVTIHKGQRNWAEVGHNVVDALEHIVFPKPITAARQTLVYASAKFFKN